MICRNGDFTILTGWGNGNSTLKKATLRVLSQSECNRRYDVSKYNTNWPKINKTLPQLFQDNLLCAAVCIVQSNILCIIIIDLKKSIFNITVC